MAQPIRLTASAEVPCLTPAAVELITGLAFVEHDSVATLTAERGAYLWALGRTEAVIYTGAASGRGGFRQRVGNEFAWREDARANANAGRHAKVDLLDSGYTDWVPLVRGITERPVRAYTAAASPANWTVSGLGTNGEPLQTPATPSEWESFILGLSWILTGHRSLLGGGAWEPKVGSLNYRMHDTALARLRDLVASGAIEAIPIPRVD